MWLYRDSKDFREYILSSIVLISIFLFKPIVLQYYNIIRSFFWYSNTGTSELNRKRRSINLISFVLKEYSLS